MFLTRLSAAFCAVLFLSSCGVTYTAQTVGTEDTPLDVSVVPLTPENIKVANRSSYTPRALPAAFFATAGAGGAVHGRGALPQAPTVPNLTPPDEMVLRVPPEVQSGPYQIGIGDVVILATRAGGNSVEQLTGLLAAQRQRQGYTVRDDGAIAIPEVGAVAIAGLTVEEAEDQIFQRLVQNQLNPEFSLEVAEFNSKRASIGGAVANSVIVPITLSALHLDQAITAAGGITLKNNEFGVIRIYRDGTLYQIPLDDYFSTPSLQKTKLADGDSVYVDTDYDLTKAQAYYEQAINALDLRQRARTAALAELQSEISMRRSELSERREIFNAQLAANAVERDHVFLVGEVAKQSLVPLPFERTASLSEILFETGGFSTTTGNPAQIYVLRPAEDEQVIAYHLNAKNVVNLTMATRLELRPNDIIFVKAQPITTWGRALQQALPILLNQGADAL
ncbi:polysaccharide biosynthesis/export family protein [Thalassospira alkalitolerans]|uniref:polysaccharide biosynthesis/export family protein n=1 Tax=Thalassospira alkalitolerans TaxID=1293890 RepID=UPI003AA9BD9F